MNTKTKVITIYRDILKQAEIFRQRSLKPENKEEEELYSMVSQELYYWVAELEKTEEVNPTIK